VSSPRLDPDAILRAIRYEDKSDQHGKLRVFLGMSAGVGKTYSMLLAAQQRMKEGLDVKIGVVETHGRQETAALLKGLPVIPKKKIVYRETALEEMDIDAILKGRPELVLVDELAHSNVPGSRHPKRYQDVLELLDAGIDVYTTLNVQHLESRKDMAEEITGVPVRETVPDSILERAATVEVVDISPEELLKRLKDGKVYIGEMAERAIDNFFKEDHLTALREMALRMTAERVDQELQRLVSIRPDTYTWRAMDRLMVAISYSPYSEFLIRATRRIAYNLDAPWIVLYVDLGEGLSDSDQAQLTKNLNLARELKAEVVTVSDADIVPAIRRVARQKGVTQVLIGRPSRRPFQDFLKGGNLVERLVSESFEFDIHLIRQELVGDFSPSFWDWLKGIRIKSGPLAYWYVGWFLFGVSFISGFVNQVLTYRAVGFIYLLAVMVVGLFSSLGPVVFAAAISAIVWNYYFIPPQFTLAISSADDFILVLSYFVVALITGTLTSRVKRQESLIREREERTNFLYEIIQEIAGSEDEADYLSKIVDRVDILLNAECGIIMKDHHGRLNFKDMKSYSVILNEKDQAVAAWAFENGKAAGWSTDTLSEAKALYIPIRGHVETVGVFIFKPQGRRKLSLEKENLLYTVTRQIGISMERQFTRTRLAENKKLRDSEELHQTLLNSISHELRTPLTSILGYVPFLEDDRVAGNPENVKGVAAQLQEAGERLNQVIENLLDMTRLNSGVLSLNLEWQDIHDLINVILKKLKRNLDRHEIAVHIAENVPLLKVDFRLMEHAISNLILNAATYSPQSTCIDIAAERINGKIQIRVEDEGSGIPKEFLSQIFEKFYRMPGSAPGGTGLGLSIVKSIVELHQGNVFAENRESHRGARFVIELPVAEPPPHPMET
jgi:two-component system sensor histidine kinase KdpD